LPHQFLADAACSARNQYICHFKSPLNCSIDPA
jgi:hypothetical protein